MTVLAITTSALIPHWTLAADIAAGPPTSRSVTVYRAPDRRTPGALDLGNLAGFALVSELRTVTVPAGESRIRFAGIADGIDPSSVLITGLPDGVLEKNLDAKVLTPVNLVAMTVGRALALVRTNPKTGQVSRVPGRLRSDHSGLVFESDGGAVEALRCSGLPETFDFEPLSETRSTPTLSARVRTPQPLAVTVRLTYLARGFDWMAHYSATISADGRFMDLGAWVTLANSNSVSFPESQTQVVAGRVNRKNGVVEPLELRDWIRQIVAECWPEGTTSDLPDHHEIARAEPIWDGPSRYRLVWDDGVLPLQFRRSLSAPLPVAGLMAMAAPAPTVPAKAVLVTEEGLGDLKLYRVPDRSSVASHQAKQVRLLDRQHIPLDHYYGTDIKANSVIEAISLHHFLRTRNDAAHQLGVPLPAGQLSTFMEHGAGAPLLMAETPLRDTAVDEALKFDLGYAADVRLTSTTLNEEGEIDLTNAEEQPAPVEIGLQLESFEQLVSSDTPAVVRDGHPSFRVTVPAHGSFSIHYKTQRIRVHPVSHGPGA